VNLLVVSTSFFTGTISSGTGLVFGFSDSSRGYLKVFGFFTLGLGGEIIGSVSFPRISFSSAMIPATRFHLE